MRLPTFIKVWFGLDLFLALFPPIHWALNAAPPINGWPATLVYIIGVSGFVALSLVVAYFADRAAGEA